jgi:UDP-N-acetylglucosamine 4-epimerase
MTGYNNILITGGAGFIGSNLCEKLLECGYSVACLDNFSTGTKENIARFKKHPAFKLIEGDIRNSDTCRQAVKATDCILHHAALASVERSLHDPLHTAEVNIMGFLNMLTAARDAKSKRFIYATSSAVYGDDTTSPKTEHITGKPLSPYALTKQVNESYARIFAKTYGMTTIGLRYFNVFGKRQPPHGNYAAVIPRFITKLLQHESPLINGDGEHSRDFTYIDNVVHINRLAIETTRPAALNEVYNTAFGQQTTINQLLEYLKEYLSERDPEIAAIQPIHGPCRAGDIPHSLANIDKAKKLLGYLPQYSIKEGLRETVKWYCDQMK